MLSIRVLLLSCLLWFVAGTTAQAFTLKDSHGHTHHLSDYRGKWVLVNFWATWCAACIEEIPDLAALYNAHKDRDLMVLGIVMEYPTEKIARDFVKEHRIPYPIILGSYKISRQIGDVAVFPTSYLYDPAGKLVSYQPGVVSREVVEEFIYKQK